MSAWQELIKVAMLGTARQPLPELPADDPAAPLASGPGQSAEAQLLDQLAIHAFRRRAGAVPALRPGKWPRPAPADNLPLCSPTAADSLHTFISQSKTWLVREWLELAALKGVRPPDERLPDLLDAGRRIKSIRHLVYDSLGGRGRWLAQQKPEWLYATLDMNDEAACGRLLASGKVLERQFYLERLRAVDSERGRRQIETLWTGASPRLQTLMLDLMLPQLSLTDERFLEGLLDRGAVNVRRRVVELLSRLPGSELCGRMADRAANYLFWRPGRGRRPAFLELKMPTIVSPDLQRDGLILTRGRDGLTQMGWRLLHLVRSTPLSTWTELFPCSIEEIIAAGLASDWDRSLIRGWSVAAQRQDNNAWAEALLFSCNGTVEGRYGVSALIGTLDPVKREQFTLAMLEQPSQLPEYQRYTTEAAVLRECKHDWSEPFARQIRRHFLNHIRADQTTVQPQLVLHRTLRQAANRFPPSLYEESRAELEPLGATYKRWLSPIQGFLRAMQTRAEMHRSLGD